MIECPSHLLYHHRHFWIAVDSSESSATVGITQEMQDRLPEIISIDLPEHGVDLEVDQPCFHLHLPSGIRHLKSPLSGRVLEINREILDNPELLHLDPYENWLLKMELDSSEDLHSLMNADKYAAYLETL